jgi:hypothetical protein
MSEFVLHTVTHLNLLAGTMAPGAPMLHLALQYNKENGNLSGEAAITQAIAQPAGRIIIKSVSGRVFVTGLGPAKRLITLHGVYDVPFGPPPIIGEIQQKFEAHFVTDEAWEGFGGFVYGPHTVENVPIKPVKK